MKRVFAFVLALVLMVSVVAMPAAAATATNISPEINEPLKAEIKRQLDAYADTFDVENADEKAVEALLDHATELTGTDILAGPEHPLTATIWNSASFTEGLSKALSLTLAEDADLDLLGQHSWYSSKPPRYSYRHSGDLKQFIAEDFTGKTNDYDNSLELVVGGASVRVQSRMVSQNADSTTYGLSVRVYDNFDFNNTKNYDKWAEKFGTGAIFEKLLTLLGLLLEGTNQVEPFFWYTYATTTVTIPHDLVEEEEVPEETVKDTTIPSGETAIANYAASITDSNTAEDALKQLMGYGYIGGGQDQTLKADDPMMANLLSSSLFQGTFTRFFNGFTQRKLESVRYEGTMSFSRVSRYFMLDEDVTAFKAGQKYNSHVSANVYDAVMFLTNDIDFTIDFTAIEENGEKLYRADITINDRFDKNDESLRKLLVGINMDPSFLDSLTSYNWTGTASFILNDYV